MTAGRMSFLEELLADEPARPDAKKRGKSVRFTDDGGDILETLSRPISRQNASHPLPAKSEAENEKPDTTPAKTESKSNWLGLFDDEELNTSRAPPKPIINTSQGDERRPSSENWLSQDDRRTKDRQLRPPSPDSVFSDLSPRTKQSVPNELSRSTSRSREILPHDMSQKSSDSGSALSCNQSDFVQSRLSMLEMENSHLLTTIKQLNDNHQSEIATLKTLYEQRLEMTTEVYKKQEVMLQEEKDRRLNDLRDQLAASEKEKESLRSQYNERVTHLERECREESERLREFHENMIRRLTQQHEADIERLGRIKSQELDALNALHNQSNSLENLIDKWQLNADRIENLHKSLMQKEEESIRDKVQALEGKEKSLNLLEEGWLTVKREIEREKLSYQDTNEKLTRLIDDQRNIIEKERDEMLEERKLLFSERKSFEEERSRIESDLTKQRELLNRELEETKDKSDRLDERTIMLVKKETEFSSRESEHKNEILKEKEELARMRNELNDERKSLISGQSIFQESLAKLQNEQQLFEQKKLLFDSEKDKLRLLAERIIEKAGELEILGETAIKDRIEGAKALETATMIKEQTEKRLEKTKQKLDKLAAESIRIESEKQKLYQEWTALKETKNLIVCSVCGGALSKVKCWQNDMKWYPERFKKFTLPNAGMDDTDQMLLIWRIAAEDDIEELARETEFLKSLKSQPD